MCHWVSDIPYQVLTAVAAKKTNAVAVNQHLGFSVSLKSERPAVWKRASFITMNLLSAAHTQSSYTRRDMSLLFLKKKKMAQYSSILTHAVVSYRFAGRGGGGRGERERKGHSYQNFKNMIQTNVFFLSISALIVCKAA